MSCLYINIFAHVRLQYHCSIFAAYLQSVLHVHWTDLQYPLKCSEVCFEVQRSAYFAALGLHCRRTWDSIATLSDHKYK